MKVLEKIQKKQADMIGEAPVTIAFLGDSVTQGCFECYLTSPTSIETVFDYENAYSTHLKSMLGLLYPNVQINIVNSGVSGDRAAVGLGRLDRDVLRYQPDLVVVGYALNDACRGEKGLTEYGECLRAILRKIRESGAEVILLTPNMMDTGASCHLTDKYFLELAERFAAIQNGGLLDRYVETAKKIAAEEGAVVCDVYARWKAMAAAGVNVTELLANKLNHPVRRMHEMTAFLLCACLFEQ